ncbi:RNA polymerase sigma factor [Actinophytocola sp.]|uniref:RNA polymerase sigma factor n=1 Tax=Actinophytocola sp. TaxID=1872138 RepID=UPI003D6A421A
MREDAAAGDVAERVPPDQEELFHAARGGDREALAELVRRLTPMLWQVARSQGLDREASVDVVQTTWLRLLGSLARIRQPAALTAWLVTVTRREAWRVHKAGRAEHVEEDAVFVEMRDAGPGPAEQVVEQVAAGDRRARLWAAVDALPERCRTLLRVIAFTRRPDYAEVSRTLGMPVGSIGPNRGRCLAMLRRLLLSDPAGGWR